MNLFVKIKELNVDNGGTNDLCHLRPEYNTAQVRHVSICVHHYNRDNKL